MAHIRNCVPSILVAAACGAAPALADDYRAEVALSGQRVNVDALPHGNVFTAMGTYYLDAVRTDGLPLAEAAFLNRSSYADASIQRVEFSGTHLNSYDADLGYYLPNTILFGRLGVSHVDLDIDDNTNVNGTFGIAPLDGLLLTTDFDENGWDPNVAARYVHGLPNGHYYAAGASFVDPDGVGDTLVGVDFDYYLDLTFRIGAGYIDANDSFTLRAEKFFTPKFAVGASAFNADGSDGFNATVRWRL